MTSRKKRRRRFLQNYIGLEKQTLEFIDCETDEEENSSTLSLDLNEYWRSSLRLSNCHVVLKPGFDMSRFLMTSTQYITVEDVLFVIKPFFEENSRCPVCWECPVIPVMSKCGHIFCWRCLVLSISINRDEINSAKCPECKKIIVYTEVRLVVWRYVEQPKINDKIDMYLCQRVSNQNFTSIVSHSTEKHFSLKEEIYMHKDGMWRVDTRCYASNWNFNYVLTCPTKPSNIVRFFNQVYSFFQKYMETPDEFFHHTECLIMIENCLLNMIKTLKDCPTRAPKLISNKKMHLYKFYQVPYSHNVFLHPDNYRQIARELRVQYMPIKEYGPYIFGVVVKLIHLRVNLQIIKKYNFLSHIPLNSEFTFCFINLHKPKITLEPLINFENVEHDSSSSDECDSYYYKTVRTNSSTYIDETSLRNLTNYTLNSVNP